MKPTQPIEFKRKFCIAVRTKKIEKGIANKDLASHLGIKLGGLNIKLYGGNAFSFYEAVKIAKLLDIDLNELKEGVE